MWRSTLNRLSPWLVCAVFLSSAIGIDALGQDGGGAVEAGGAELALVPVGSSAQHVINGNEIIIPSGSATVELELRASSLQENGDVCIIGYGAQIDSSGYSSGSSGTLAPAKIPCVTDDDCSGFPICKDGACDVRAAAFIDVDRPDFLFAGVDGLITVDINTLDFRFYASMFFCRVRDSGYCGTLILDVPDDAAGTFTVGFLPFPGSGVVDVFNNLIDPLALTPASITITRTECGNGMVELGEECDGTDDTACPGACLSDCTCASCGNGTCDPIEDSCTCSADCGTPPASEVPLATCTDGIDNDCDGSIDSADPDCPAIPTVSSWGLAIMALLLLTAAKVSSRSRVDRRPVPDANGQGVQFLSAAVGPPGESALHHG